jgi:hypothetical protein
MVFWVRCGSLKPNLIRNGGILSQRLVNNHRNPYLLPPTRRLRGIIYFSDGADLTLQNVRT